VPVDAIETIEDAFAVRGRDPGTRIDYLQHRSVAAIRHHNTDAPTVGTVFDGIVD
jgi:hypothetical protein